MKQFMDENFLLDTKTAQDLFHNHAAKMPIIDYHCHLIPEMVANDHKFTEIIAASVRHPMHVTQCALAGADIATVPFKVLEQMTHHPLTDAGIVKFQNDYKAVFGE